jgi:hypothetical protein
MEYHEVIESIDKQNEWSYDIFITVKHFYYRLHSTSVELYLGF